MIGTSSANCPLWSVHLQLQKQDLPNVVDPGDSITQGASDQSMGFGMAAELQAGLSPPRWTINISSLALDSVKGSTILANLIDYSIRKEI